MSIMCFRALGLEGIAGLLDEYPFRPVQEQARETDALLGAWRQRVLPLLGLAQAAAPATAARRIPARAAWSGVKRIGGERVAQRRGNVPSGRNGRCGMKYTG